MEADVDDPEVSPNSQRQLLGAGFAPPATVQGASDVLAELARAVDEDLATPDHAPATERAYAHDWDDFVGFCELHGLEPLPAAPQTLALYLKALETRRSRSPRAMRTVVTGLPDGVRALGLALPTARRDRFAARDRGA